MADIEDGETTEVQGSGAKPYILKNVGGVYSCSCPAWRNQSHPIERRTCKHLRKLRGEEAEKERLGGELPVRAVASKSSKVGPPVLLAHAWDSSQDLTDWWMSEKLDGVRAYWDGQRFMSRQGNEYMAPDWFIEGLPDTPLDGELWIERKMFQRTVSVVRRQDKSDMWKEVRYLVFDAPQATGGFEDRLDFLKESITSRQSYAEFHPHIRCQNEQHLQEELARVESLGGEGLMLRQPASNYEIGRSSTLLKVKTFHDAEAVVIDHQAGKGKHRGRMGAVQVRLADGTEFSVGTGFTDKQRESPPEIGSQITFRYQEMTDGGVPRFPSFIRADQTLKDSKEDTRHTLDASTVRTITSPKRSSSKKRAPRKVPVATPSDSASQRYFEFVGANSSKFWEIYVDDIEVTVRYGRIGANGTSKTKEFANETKANEHVEKLISEKTAKGYLETEQEPQ
jgi:DNA ligase 1